METKGKTYELIFEEAFVPSFYLNAHFILDGIEYRASARHYPGDGIEDFEVLYGEDEEIVYDEDSDAYKIGLDLIRFMDIKNNITY